MNHWYVQVFLAVGGAALLWKAAKEGIPQAVGVGMKWLLGHPAVKIAVIENRENIKAIIEGTEQELIKDIDAASDVPPTA